MNFKNSANAGQQKQRLSNALIAALFFFFLHVGDTAFQRSLQGSQGTP